MVRVKLGSSPASIACTDRSVTAMYIACVRVLDSPWKSRGRNFSQRERVWAVRRREVRWRVQGSREDQAAAPAHLRSSGLTDSVLRKLDLEEQASARARGSRVARVDTHSVGCVDLPAEELEGKRRCVVAWRANGIRMETGRVSRGVTCRRRLPRRDSGWRGSDASLRSPSYRREGGRGRRKRARRTFLDLGLMKAGTRDVTWYRLAGSDGPLL